jgi:hypothetical protein
LPTLLRLDAQNGAKTMMVAEFNRVLLLVQIFSAVTVVSVCVVTPILLHFVLPVYEPAARTIGILTIAGAFTGLVQALNDVSMSFGVKAAVLKSTIAALIIEALLLTIAWQYVGQIEAIAFAVLTTMAGLVLPSLWLASRAAGQDIVDTKRLVVKIITRAILVAVCCLFVLESQIHVVNKLKSSPELMAIGSFVYLLALSIFVFFIIHIARKFFGEK